MEASTTFMLIGLAGVGLLWFDLRSLRRKVQERAKASSDPSHVRSGRDAVLASSFKGVAGGALMVAFGVIGLRDRLTQIVLVGSSYRSHGKNMGTKKVPFKAFGLIGVRFFASCS